MKYYFTERDPSTGKKTYFPVVYHKVGHARTILPTPYRTATEAQEEGKRKQAEADMQSVKGN